MDIYAQLILSPATTLLEKVKDASFSTGKDSPVKEDSFVFKLTDSIRRRSAPIVSPSSKITTSPRTNSVDLTLNLFPSLTTVDSGEDKFFKASKEVCALTS